MSRGQVPFFSSSKEMQCLYLHKFKKLTLGKFSHTSSVILFTILTVAEMTQGKNIKDIKIYNM